MFFLVKMLSLTRPGQHKRNVAVAAFGHRGRPKFMKKLGFCMECMLKTHFCEVRVKSENHETLFLATSVFDAP